MTMRKALLLVWIVVCGLFGFLSAENKAFSDTPKQAPAVADTDVADFGDWRFACAQPDKKIPKECRIFQRVSWGQDKARQMTMSVIMFAMDDKAAAASKAKDKPVVLMRAVMPLGVDLRPGLGMAIGKGAKTMAIPYSLCVPAGCLVTTGLGSGIVDKIKTADQIIIAYKTPGPGKAVGLKVSTKGFGQAVDALMKAKKTKG
jgi:invasion protein IalB